MAGPERAERDEAIRRRMESPEATAVEKGLAAVAGAAEGFAEISKTTDLPALAGEAVDRVAETWRAVRTETRAPGREPSLGTARAVEGPATDIPAPPPPAPSAAGERATATVENAERYTRAVGQVARRASELPAALGHHVRSTTRVVAKDAAGAAIGYTVATIAGLFALGFFSVVVAALLNGVLGPPVGSLIVAVVYAIVAVGALIFAQREVRSVGEDARAGIRSVREEVRNVGRPLGEVR